MRPIRPRWPTPYKKGSGVLCGKRPQCRSGSAGAIALTCAAWAVAWMCAGAAAGPATRTKPPPHTPKGPSARPASQSAPAAALTQADIDSLVATDWYGVYVQGNKAGYARIGAGRETRAGVPVLVETFQVHLEMLSMGHKMRMEFQGSEVFEARPPYALLRAEELTKQGGDYVQRVVVERKGTGYVASVTQAGATRTRELPALRHTLPDSDNVAPVLWLRRGPKVGDSIVCRTLDFDELRPKNLTCRLKAVRDTVAGGVAIRYYEVEQSQEDDMKFTVRCDAKGKVLSGFFGGFVEVRLEPRKVATDVKAAADIFVLNTVRIDKPLGESGAVRRLVLLAEGEAAGQIGPAPGQTVRPAAAGKAHEIILDPAAGPKVPATKDDVRKNLQETVALPIRDAQVTALARKAVGDAKDPAKQVARLVAFVDSYIQDDYSTEPLSVPDIIKVRRGDCTEHSALFAALARSLGIPCRTVGGLMYMGDREQAFGMHAWDEVVLDGHWVGVDPTHGQVRIDATHIRFPVDGGAELDVMGALPKLKLTVRQVQTAAGGSSERQRRSLLRVGARGLPIARIPGTRNQERATRTNMPTIPRIARHLLMAMMAAAAPRPAGTTIGIDKTAFTLNGRPGFLLGASYYGALGAPEEFVRRDLDDLKARGVNWVRVWGTWAPGGGNVSAVTPQAQPREPYLGRLKRLVQEADSRGIVVDVTFSRGNGAVANEPLLAGQAGHLQAVQTVAKALRPHRNVYIDVSNERNIRDARHTPIQEVRELRDRIKQVDPDRLVTASHAGDLSRQDVEAYVVTAKLDFLSPHRPRNAASPRQTAERAAQCFAWMRELGRVVPVHYQEPFRRDFFPPLQGTGKAIRPAQDQHVVKEAKVNSPWQPKAIDFLVDLWEARRGAAAGWCLHNGSPRGSLAGPPRSFDLRKARLLDQLDDQERIVLARAAVPANAATRTWVTLLDGRWYVNGEVTCPGAAAEGLLMNVRMVNSVFEDRDPKTHPNGFDPDRNTDAFVARVPDYVSHGMRAFTISLQGGMPGYEGAINSAFEPDGRLREEYMRRVRRVIDAADKAGAGVILCCYYQRQDQVLRGEAAVRAGVVNAAAWVRDNGLANVMLEIANEYPHGGFDHKTLRDPKALAGLIRLARSTAPGLLVSASGLGNGRCDEEVCQAADFILIHFNSTPVEQIASRVKALRRYGKAIVCNEDDKPGAEGARAAEAAVNAGCSWGLMLSKLNQYVPFGFKGHADDPAIYAKVKDLTTPRK